MAVTVLNDAYRLLGRILNISGGLTLNKVQTEVVPVHGLEGLAAYQLGKLRVYRHTQASIIVDTVDNLDLNNSGAWDEVSVDGALTNENIDPTWDKVILWCGGRSVLNQANWASSFVERNGGFGFATNVATTLMNWTNLDFNNRFVQNDPLPWPVRMVTNETSISLGTDITATGGGNETSVSFLVVLATAPPGLMGLY